MLRAGTESVAFGKPHAHNECHIDPFVAELEVKMDCVLTQNGKETGVIHVGEAAVMKVRVGLRGPLLHHLCGEICVRTHVECIGPGPEKTFTTDTQPIEGENGRKCCEHRNNNNGNHDDDGWCYYDFKVEIPADTFESHDPEHCGEVCCFATTATTIDRCGNPGHIACWCNGPCAFIHKAPED